ncbi:hypothetical protein [Aeoliella sp.]|uniref:hypothetical protein n=1 Tax=Aeoliella sp. TaxID=2795800 RepID=UPI003CCBC821
MLRKLILRFFLACFAMVGLVITTVVVAGYFALQQPSYYAQLRAVAYSPAEQSAAELSMRQTEANVKRWLQSSIARQQAASADEPSVMQLLAGAGAPYDPTTDTHEVHLTQAQFNAHLASNKASRSGDWRNPRIRFGEDRIDLAFEVASDEFSCVPSISLEPSLTDDGKLRLGIVSAHIGQLPLPMKTILTNLPSEMTRPAASGDVELDLSAETPCVIVNLPTADSKSPTVSALTCREGELVVELLPPVVGESL